MPTLVNPNQKQEEDDKKQSNISSGLGVSSPQGQTGQQGPTSSGRFTNIQKYLGANQQAGAKVANTIGKDIEKQTQNVANAIQGSKQQFQTQANQGRLTQNDLTSAQNVIQGAGLGTQANDISQFQRISSGQYKGPQEMQDSDKLSAKTQNVVQQGKQLENQGGRFNLLRQYFSTPTYTKGQQNLDEMILGQNNQNLGNVKRQTLGLQSLTSQELNAARQLAGEYANQSRDIGKRTQEELSKATTADTEALSNKFRQAQEKETELAGLYKKRAGDISQGMVDEETANALGLSNLIGKNIYNLDLGSYLKTDAPQTLADAREVASREEAARINALNKLAGRDNVYDLENVGTYKQSQQQLDLDKLNKDIAAREAEYKAAEQSAKDYSTFAEKYGADWRGENKGDINQRYQDVVNRLGGYTGFTGNELANKATADYWRDQANRLQANRVLSKKV